MNKTYCRMTLVTGGEHPKRTLTQFNGVIRWKGFSERLNVDIGTSGCVSHRRVVFSTPARFSSTVTLSDLVSPSDGRVGRSPLRSVSDTGCGEWLDLLFEERTVDGLMLGPLKKQFVTVMESSMKTYNGVAGGSRRSRKFWNALGKSVSYDISAGPGSLMEWSSAQSVVQNVYVFDLFQYGVDSVEVPASIAKSESASSKPRVGKPVKGTAMQIDSSEDEDDWAKVRTEMSLYYYGDGV